MADGKVPIQESVGAALRFARENIRPISIAAMLAALAGTVVSLAGASLPGLLPMFLAISSLVAATLYGVYLALAQGAIEPLKNGVLGRGSRVWTAMAIVAFFLLIVFIVPVIAASAFLAVLLVNRYPTEMQTVGNDQVAMAALVERVLTENPNVTLVFMLVSALLWMMLTSRLYLAAPASVAEGRIRTFETWSWTKGNMWRIIGARMLLLFPALILVNGIGFLATLANQSPVLLAITTFAAAWLQYALYYSLEAGLSAYLYKGLKPAETITPT